MHAPDHHADSDACADADARADTDVTVRAARIGEGRLVQRLLLPADPTRPENFEPVASMVDTPFMYDTTWCLPRAGIAVTGTGRPVGAVITTPPAQWLHKLRDRFSEQDVADLSWQIQFIAAIAVQPEARGQGIGRKLLRYAEEIVASRRCVLLCLDFDPAVQGLDAFYTACGYTILGDGQYMSFTCDEAPLTYVPSAGYQLACKPLGDAQWSDS